MSLKNAVSVRFSDATVRRLATVAGKSHLSKADLVRRATEEFIARAESEGNITIEVLAETPPPYRTKRC